MRSFLKIFCHYFSELKILGKKCILHWMRYSGFKKILSLILIPMSFFGLFIFIVNLYGFGLFYFFTFLFIVILSILTSLLIGRHTKKINKKTLKSVTIFKFAYQASAFLVFFGLGVIPGFLASIFILFDSERLGFLLMIFLRRAENFYLTAGILLWLVMLFSGRTILTNKNTIIEKETS